MLEYTFSIKHRGCWTEAVNVTFPDIEATIIYSYRLGSTSVTMIEATNVADPDAFVAWLSDHEVMTTAHLINYDEAQQTAFVSLAGDYDTETEPVLNVLLRNECFPTVPSTVENGWEHWSVVASSHELVSKAHKDLSELGTVEVESLKSPELDRMLTGLTEVKQAVQNLSPRQREVLGRAIDEGYYDSPRACKLAELAELDSANTSTVGEHLRRSEAKILKAVKPLLTKEANA
ncbi:helix-turn-helix domain-containing protein [Haladaptatus sp. DJG-WS-42]|uniref:helix-turn-helix domain-containing protein n=1 Tax=Haladaptatus sp. DJG-WS-42 TaxID=3120516 RepID=UPI0030CE9BD6